MPIRICALHIKLKYSIFHAWLLSGFNVWKKTPKNKHFATTAPRASHREPVNPNADPSFDRRSSVAAQPLQIALHLLLQGVAAAVDEMVAAKNCSPRLQIFFMSTIKTHAAFSLQKNFILFCGGRDWAHFVLPQDRQCLDFWEFCGKRQQ